jgi:hypothetical protein
MKYIMINDNDNDNYKIYVNRIYDNIQKLDGIEYLFKYMGLYCILYGLLYSFFFKNILFIKLNYNRKLYVIKNIAKSIGLFFLSIYSSKTLYNAVVYDIWDNKKIHILGFMYASSDILSLILVRKLPNSTKIHHTSVLFLCIVNSLTDYSIPIHWRGIVIYAFFSSYTYLVNTYLGVRLVTSKENSKLICRLAMYIYVILCTVCWIYQFNNYIYWIFNKFTFSLLINMFLISMVIYDDLILIDYLKKNSY